MSIHDSLNKIKGSFWLDKTTFFYLFLVLGVGIVSFGLGRLSVDTGATKGSGITITQEASAYKSQSNTESRSLNTQPESSRSLSSQSGTEKNYVASKNGKLYYPNGCKSANRIKPQNEVWFASASDAEKVGYARASSCK